jgi:hypothetical protein
VRSLHVQLHVALLREAHDAVVTAVGPLPGVLLHVHLQRALLVEGLLTQRAVEWTLPCAQKAPCQGQHRQSTHSAEVHNS